MQTRGNKTYFKNPLSVPELEVADDLICRQGIFCEELFINNTRITTDPQGNLIALHRDLNNRPTCGF